MVLDPTYQDKIYDSSLRYRTSGYSDTMDVIFSLDEGNYTAFDNFDVRKIVPQIGNTDENHLFVCLPLQEAGGCIGYIVFVDDYEKFKSTVLLGKYVEHLSTVLSKFQKTINAWILNERLIELSQIDALTHVKNRAAYQSKENYINQKIRRNACEDFAILMCDVNNLKKVNDEYGHENGDSYIINSCRMICKTFKRSAVYRIGGDEFVVLLDGDDFGNATELIESLEKEMQRLSKQDLPIWDKISVATGIAYYDSKTDKCMLDVLKRADEAMYNKKSLMKVARQ